MDRKIKLGLRIQREFQFLNSDVVQEFIDNHEWIQEKYYSDNIYDLAQISDEMLEFLESKRERYADLEHIIKEEALKENYSIEKDLSSEFKEYAFLQKLDELRASIKHKEILQKHLQFLLGYLNLLVESQQLQQVEVSMSRTSLTHADKVQEILELFGFSQKVQTNQVENDIEMQCVAPNPQLAHRAIQHMTTNLKEEIYFDEISYQKEQLRLKELQKKLDSLASYKHQINEYHDFHRKDWQPTQKTVQQGKVWHKDNNVNQRVQQQIMAQSLKNKSMPVNASTDINQYARFERQAEIDILRIINQYRSQKGMESLQMREEISNICRLHSNQMGLMNTSFGHENYQERKQKLQQLFPKIQVSNENVSQFSSYLGLAQSVVENWISTPGNSNNVFSLTNSAGVGAFRSQSGVWFITFISCFIPKL